MSVNSRKRQTPKSVPADEILGALFAVVTEEAGKNPAFARRLLSIFPEAIVARIDRTVKKYSPGTPDINAVIVLRQHNESMLRGQLSGVRSKAGLKTVARNSALKLTGKPARASATRADIIDGIVDAAKQYVAQRG